MIIKNAVNKNGIAFICTYCERNCKRSVNMLFYKKYFLLQQK